MIYLDTSVLLADLFAEDHRPLEAFWDGELVSSRLLEYEAWNRLNAGGHSASHGRWLDARLARISLLELAPEMLARALAPFPEPVRTLDALHLASAIYLRGFRADLKLATFDRRQLKAAEALGLAVIDRREA